MDRLNKIESPIDFSYELETSKPLTFLIILQINNKNKLGFKVHHISANENYLFTHIITPK